VELVSDKQEPRRSNLLQVQNEVAHRYGAYEQMCECLHQMPDSPFSGSEVKDDLEHCYDKPTKNINAHLRIVSDNHAKSNGFYCPYCGHFPCDTLDHYLPKSVFAEFSIKANNLIPCCSKCNRLKSDTWSDEYDVFINPYFHGSIASVKFVKCELDLSDGNGIEITFSLSNMEHIESNKRQTVLNHFEKLDLLNRHRDHSRQVIGEYLENVKYLVGSGEDIAPYLSNQFVILSAKYGINHWKTSLLEAMLDKCSDLVLFVTS